MTTPHADNIADSGDPRAAVAPHPASAAAHTGAAGADVAITDAYLKRFDDLDHELTQGRAFVDSLSGQPDSYSMLLVVINYVKHQQKLMEDLYDLLVEMNNNFGAK